MTKPISMKNAMQVLQAATKLSTVDVFIQHVNSRFATKADMLRQRCSPEVGHFYSISLDLEATVEDCLEIEAAFRPHWPAAKVVYWQGKLSIQLNTAKNPNWTSHYNGKLITQALL